MLFIFALLTPQRFKKKRSCNPGLFVPVSHAEHDPLKIHLCVAAVFVIEEPKPVKHEGRECKTCGG